MRIFNLVVMIMVILMSTMALAPLSGLDLVLLGRYALVDTLIDDSNLHLFMVRSAAFATFASFALNYLRRRRPLSSVAPLLYFSLCALVFGPLYVYIYAEFHWRHLPFFIFTASLAFILFKENEKEAKTIFIDNW